MNITWESLIFQSDQNSYTTSNTHVVGEDITLSLSVLMLCLFWSVGCDDAVACIGCDDVEPWVSPAFKRPGLVPYTPPPCRSASIGHVHDVFLVVRRVDLCMDVDFAHLLRYTLLVLWTSSILVHLHGNKIMTEIWVHLLPSKCNYATSHACRWHDWAIIIFLFTRF
jgi:hypothetical protein